MLIVVAIATLAGANAIPLLGWRRVLVAGTLLTLTLAPVPLIGLGDTSVEYVVGLAPPYPTITATTVALAVGGLWALSQGVPNIAWIPLVPIVASTAICASLVWPHTQMVTSGVIHIVSACVAWYVGVAMSRFGRIGQADSQFTARVAVGITLALSLPSWIQWINGVGIDGYGERTGGIFSVPSTAGKIATLLVCLLLPLTKSKDRKTMRSATVAIVIAVSATLPSLSRANIVAIALVLLGWFIMNIRRVRISRVVGAAIIFGALAAPFIHAVLDRFTSDPDGGDRPELMAAALRHIPDHLFTGVGANNYVAAIRDLEPIVARTGYPVHNIFVLFFAEVGLVGALSFLPLLALALLPTLGRLRATENALYAKAFLLLMGAVSFIGWTGWAVLRAPTGELVAFLAGMLWAQANAITPRVVESERRTGPGRTVEDEVSPLASRGIAFGRR
jgi:hypothetical protein